jgi:hypothetical protein
MRPPVRRLGALVIALLLAVPSVGAPQASSSVAGLAGDWEGWARLDNDWPGHGCRYEGTKEEIAIRLALGSVDGRLQGSVAIDLPAAEGSGCPPLRQRHLVTEVVLAEGLVSLTDSGGHDWDLALKRNGRVLRGLMAWQQGGADRPLAEGFRFADGVQPRSRLRGEVRLQKVETTPGEEATSLGEAGAEGGAEAAAPAERTIGGGDYVKYLGAVLGATAVGLAGLYGVNQLGQGSSEEGTITCSPRRCIVGAPQEPCFCEGNVVSGSECGASETGVPIGGNCNWPTEPCQALLSCNSGICEDRFGRCPFN